MKTVEIFDEENSITIDDQYDTTYFTFNPEDKTFKVSRSVKDDCFYNKQTIEYKISVNPVDLQMRTLESSHEPPLEYSIKDGVVSESELKKKNFVSSDRIENLKKEVEWSSIPLFGNFEVNLYILFLHPEIISKNEYRKFLREAEQRIKSGLTKIEERLKEKDKTGLQITDEYADSGRALWYPKTKEVEMSGDETKKVIDYVDGFQKSLFEEKSSEYCGISKYEFQESSFILKHLDKLLNEKEKASTKKDVVAEKKNPWRWIGYAWVVIINLITIGVVLAIYDKVYKSFEIIVISILILIYLSFQSFLMIYSQTITVTAFGLGIEFKRIRRLLKDEPDKYEKEEIQETKKKVDKAAIKMHINALFLFIIYLITLFYLFDAL
jgi:hypothetical protein